MADGEVRLWRLLLDRDPPRSGDADLLSIDERARAQRFRRAADQRRWAAGRAFLRRVLGHHLDVLPARVELMAGANDKPSIAGAPAVFFNVSHSADLVVVAVTAAGDVGVDVERERDDLDPIALARTAFGDQVAVRLAGLAPESQRAEFFRMWVRHEAVVKCLGVGLGAAPEPGDPEPWTAEVDVAAGYCAAVAVSPRAVGPLRVTVRSSGELPVG